MTTTRFSLAIALAGCGRVGFLDVAGPPGGDAGSDGASGDAVTLVVTSDEYLGDPAGMPIAGATVLVERSAGTDRLATDAAGRVQFAAAGVIACHVVYHSSVGWRGTTVQSPPAGTIELGSRPAFNQNRSVTLALPPSTGADEYTVRLPGHCAFPPLSGSPSVQVSYAPACDGAAVHAIGFAFGGPGVPDRYLDAGTVALRDGATQPLTGTYQLLPTRVVELTDLPAGSAGVTAELLARAGGDLTPLTPHLDSATPSGGAATLGVEAPASGNGLEITAFGGLPVQYSASSALILPLSAATPTRISARDMLPLFDSMTLTDPTRIAWTGGAGGAIAIVERIGGDFQWDWYLPASATEARLPAIPADLGVPAAEVPASASVVKLAVPGAADADLLPTVDRRWSMWPLDAALLPAAGGAMTRILYTAALGPP